MPTTRIPEGAEQLIRARAVTAMTGLNRTTIWRLMRDGRFPQSVPLIGNKIAWRLSDVSAWITERSAGKAA